MGSGLSLGSVVRDEERCVPAEASARRLGKPEIKPGFRSGTQDGPAFDIPP